MYNQKLVTDWFQSFTKIRFCPLKLDKIEGSCNRKVFILKCFHTRKIDFIDQYESAEY